MVEESEVWVEIEEFPHYEVSNFGSVYNARMRRELYLRQTPAGYLVVTLHDNGRRKDFLVHRLVAKAFLVDFREGLQITHVDRDFTNNHVSNLRVRGGRRDVVHRYEATNRGGGRVRIVETGQVFLNAYSAARHLNTDASSIYRCLRNARKRHLGYRFEYF